jgi:signal transduction histidine kinase
MPATSSDMERSIARCRVVLCVVMVLVLFVDPMTGGAFALDRYWATVLAAHFVYGCAILALHDRTRLRRALAAITTVGDVGFVAAVATVTEGTTSPFYSFFAFAVLSAGLRSGLQAALLVTATSVALYVMLVLALSPPGQHLYLFMRAAYIAITGYLVGFFGQERLRQEARILGLEAHAQRERIARSLHDGHMQALAGVNLRLETCQELLRRGATGDALAEIADLQRGVNREYDELRAYIRSLLALEEKERAGREDDTRVRVRAEFEGSVRFVEHVLQIMLEGARNVRSHARATSASIEARAAAGGLRLTIDDDGVGFPDQVDSSWSIASRVSECGGTLRLLRDGRPGAHVAVELPVT